MPSKATMIAGAIHTVTLEDQGVPADIAAHRRSIHASDRCDGPVVSDRWNANVGRRVPFTVRCQNRAISFIDGKNFCEKHRP